MINCILFECFENDFVIEDYKIVGKGIELYFIGLINVFNESK